MDWVKSTAFRYVATLLAGALVVMALMLAIKVMGHRPSGAFIAAVTLAYFAAMYVVVGRYWRGIDEAAREAQKSAWFWGGSIAAGLAALVLINNPFGVLDLIIPADADRASLLRHGAFIMAFSQFAGFFVAWAWWWWRRR
jgi:hypothetical protein